MTTANGSTLRHAQNFLHSRRLVASLVDASSITKRDLVLDIGAGYGIIADTLAPRCRQVVAIEPDPRLARGLRDHFAGSANVRIEQADFRTMNLPVESYKVFASLPFNVTAAIMAKLTTGGSPPADAFLVVQREAAERYLGSPRQTLTALRLYPWYECSILHTFRRTDFSPVPHVDAVLLRLRPRARPRISAADASLYHDLVTYCFTAWKPTLCETVGTLVGPGEAARILRTQGIATNAVPSAVGGEQWLSLAQWLIDRLGQRGTKKVLGSANRLAQQQATLRKCHRTAAARQRSDR